MFGSFEIRKKYLILLAMTGLLVCLDQASKIYIHTHLALGQEIEVIKNFFNITYVRNYGAAFGILAQAPENFRDIFFLMMPPIALTIILFIMKGVPERDRLTVFALSSVFGGAIGNYLDRIFHGYVIDFLDFYLSKGTIPLSSIGFANDYPAIRASHWPAFNVADIAIVSGVMLLILLEIIKIIETKKQTEKDAPAKEAQATDS